MNDILKKLRLAGHDPVLIIDAPEGYVAVLDSINSDIHTSPQGSYSFIQIFAMDIITAEKHLKEVVNLLEEGGYLWFCYPKGSSKKYHSELNRNKAIELFGPYDFEGVTQISIDEDWSAIRFKYVDDIKVMKRKWAGSKKGKERISKNIDLNGSG